MRLPYSAKLNARPSRSRKIEAPEISFVNGIARVRSIVIMPEHAPTSCEHIRSNATRQRQRPDDRQRSNDAVVHSRGNSSRRLRRELRLEGRVTAWELTQSISPMPHRGSFSARDGAAVGRVPNSSEAWDQN